MGKQRERDWKNWWHTCSLRDARLAIGEGNSVFESSDDTDSSLYLSANMRKVIMEYRSI